MQVRVCDRCGEPAEKEINASYMDSGKLLCDMGAKIVVSLSFGFKNHTTGFGGPPDLCKPCRDSFILALYNTLNPQPEKAK